MTRSGTAASNEVDDSRYAAIYARVSTEDQGKGFSIPTQIEASQKLAEREGYTVLEGQTLVDEGLSGMTMDRPGLRKVRELVNAGAIAAVIVYDPDRLSRNLGHQLLLAEEFEQAGVKLLIVSHPMEQGQEGWLFFQMRGALAEYERAKILERTRRGLIGRAQAGHPHGGQIPLGYAYLAEPHGGRWEIETDEASVVRRIFSLCLEGLPVRAIARVLSDERVPTRLDRHPQGGGSKAQGVGTWSAASIHRVLTNPTYTGTAHFNQRQRVTKTTKRLRPPEEWITFTVPPIIDQPTFRAVHEQLHLNQVHAKRNQRREYLLSGRMRCAQCGRAMGGTATKQGRRRYRCTSRSSIMDERQRCPGSINADQVEVRVWQAVEALLQNPELVMAEVQRLRQQTDEVKADVTRQLDMIAGLLAKLGREDERWTQAYAAEVIDLGELKQRRAEINQRRQSLEVQQGHLEAELTRVQVDGHQREQIMTYCARIRARLQTFSFQEQRLALQALDITVRWSVHAGLSINGVIPVGTPREEKIVSSPSRWSVLLTLEGRTAAEHYQRCLG